MRTPEEKANEIVALLEREGLSYHQMLEAIRLTQERLQDTITRNNDSWASPDQDFHIIREP